MAKGIRNLVIILGDQLNFDAPALREFDRERDMIWMAEVEKESIHVPSSKQRITVFLAAMRHFAKAIQEQNWPILYRYLDQEDNAGCFEEELVKAINATKPQCLVLTWPGEWRVLEIIKQVALEQHVPLVIHPDTHFYCSQEDFRNHAQNRKQLRQEYFYRELRQKNNILMDGSRPIGGQWNYDVDNRKSFDKTGPPSIPPPRIHQADDITQSVINLVRHRFKDHPGSLDTFNWPVTRKQALQALEDFIQFRLPHFGQYQDAMWTDEPWLYHSLISSSLNLKLLNPREVIQCAEKAFHQGSVPLAAAEGFIRQIVGWREYVRGIYWHYMPDYLHLNKMQANEELPLFYWSGTTDMACLRESLKQTLRFGYAHHIQRLMVTGLYALLYGVRPQSVHEWYLSVYVDAVEWVELPNTLGMSQFADGGLMASKPYIASGKYINRMSNYCSQCPYNPEISTGEKACPFTTLYWDYLIRHEKKLQSNPRMAMQLKNLQRLSEVDKSNIISQAQAHRRVNSGL
ncbi:MAG: hypothetical protein RLZZ438_94 [Acidobacteriota bacterium]|jgi:deoxyribodipyrimidine photolyase-related protein